MVMMLCCCYVDLRIWKCDSTPQTRACQSRYFLEICVTYHSAATSALPRLSLAGAKWAATPPPTRPSIPESLPLPPSLSLADLFNLYLTYVHSERVSQLCDEYASFHLPIEHGAEESELPPSNWRFGSSTRTLPSAPLPPRHFEVPSCHFPVVLLTFAVVSPNPSN
jgi:hypothetical protein